MNMIKLNKVDGLFILAAVYLFWRGWLTWSYVGALVIVYSLYYMFERGWDKGFVRRLK